MLTKAFAGSRPRFENGLDSLEEFFADERFMPTLVHLAAIGNHADVVSVSQHRLNLGSGYFAGGIATWASNQASVREHGLEAFDGVLAGGVQVERQPDERCPLGIHGHRSNIATVEALDDIQISQRGSPKRAALAGLLAHLVADVGPILS